MPSYATYQWETCCLQILVQQCHYLKLGISLNVHGTENIGLRSLRLCAEKVTTSCIGLNNKELRQEDIGRRDDKDMDPQSPAHQDSAEVVSRFSALLRECSAVSDPKQAEKSCFSSSLLIFVRY